MASAQQPVARWRPSLLALAGLAVCTVLSSSFAVRCAFGVAQSSHDRSTWAFLTLCFLVFALVTALLSRGRIDLFADRIDLVTWFGFKTTPIQLSDVERVDVDRTGLFICLRSGKVVSGPSTVGQKGLGLKLLRYRNRGDRIAAAIMASTPPVGREP